MYSCAWPGIPTAPGVGSDAQVFQKRWGSSVQVYHEVALRHPPQLILGYSISVPIAVQEFLFT